MLTCLPTHSLVPPPAVPAPLGSELLTPSLGGFLSPVAAPGTAPGAATGATAAAAAAPETIEVREPELRSVRGRG